MSVSKFLFILPITVMMVACSNVAPKESLEAAKPAPDAPFKAPFEPPADLPTPTSDETPVDSAETPEEPSSRPSRPSRDEQVAPTTEVGTQYRLFIPGRMKSDRSKRALVIVVHGCEQDAKVMQANSGMDAEANQHGYFVLYPDQVKGRNSHNCWRWFDRKNREPNSGELAEILATLDTVSKRHAIDKKRIFITGLSSGGATAAALLACHPERFKGAALFASPAFDIANNEVQAVAVMRLGPPFMRGFLISSCKPSLKNQRLLVVHGMSDSVVNPLHGRRLINQFIPNGTPEQTLLLKLQIPGSHETTSRCYSVESANSEACLIQVSGLKHAWAGGTAADYFDPAGFSSGELISKFLVGNESPFELARP